MGVKRVFETFNRVRTLVANINLPLITGIENGERCKQTRECSIRIYYRSSLPMYNQRCILMRPSPDPIQKENSSLPIVVQTISPARRRITRGMDFAESFFVSRAMSGISRRWKRFQWRNWWGNIYLSVLPPAPLRWTAQVYDEIKVD